MVEFDREGFEKDINEQSGMAIEYGNTRLVIPLSEMKDILDKHCSTDTGVKSCEHPSTSKVGTTNDGQLIVRCNDCNELYPVNFKDVPATSDLPEDDKLKTIKEVSEHNKKLKDKYERNVTTSGITSTSYPSHSEAKEEVV